MKDVQAATSDIVVSTSMYDDWPLHNALLTALRRKCSVQVMVDAQYGFGINQLRCTWFAQVRSGAACLPGIAALHFYHPRIKKIRFP